MPRIKTFAAQVGDDLEKRAIPRMREYAAVATQIRDILKDAATTAPSGGGGAVGAGTGGGGGDGGFAGGDIGGGGIGAGAGGGSGTSGVVSLSPESIKSLAAALTVSAGPGGSGGSSGFAGGGGGAGTVTTSGGPGGGSGASGILVPAVNELTAAVRSMGTGAGGGNSRIAAAAPVDPIPAINRGNEAVVRSVNQVAQAVQQMASRLSSDLGTATRAAGGL